MPWPDYLEPLSQGLFAIDTGFHRPRFDAAYLLVDGGRAAFLDTGTNHAVPRLLGALAAAGVTADAVDWVIPTHVHLDHAGGCGLLLTRLPKARVLVHPRGARHLIDPARLYASATAVYGAKEMERSYGTLIPVPAERVSVSRDGQQVPVGQRHLRLLHTPGHARHHHCIWDEATRGWFTGDTFGLSYREMDEGGRPWILPTSTPVQFEPEVLKHSIARLMAFEPACMYLTHYGVVREPQRLADQLLHQLDRMVELALAAPSGTGRHPWLMQQFGQLYIDRLRAHGNAWPNETILSALSMDIELNAQGIAVWLDRQAASAAHSRGKPA